MTVLLNNEDMTMRRQEGFSLIEILITMLIMSVGLLGIAGIIVTNLKNNHSAQSRGAATVLVNDIVDRMRANRIVAEPAGAAVSPYVMALGVTPADDGSVVKGDLHDWSVAVDKILPKGKGAVAYDVKSRNFTITVEWDDSRATTDTKQGDAGSFGLKNQQFIVETRL